MRKMEEDQGARLVRAMVGVLLGGVVALAACLVFLLFCSVGISGGWVQEGLMYQLAVVGCVIGGFIGSVFAIRRCGSRALVVGLVTGAVFFLLLLTGGVLFFREQISLEMGGLGLLCGAMCGGAAAGILGAGPRKRKKQRPRETGHAKK